MRTVASYAAMTTATEAVLPLVPTEEERQIRAAVRGICDGFPEDYSRSKHSRGRAADGALGRAGREGLPGHQPARGVGRRRARHGRPRRGRRGDHGRRQVAAADRRLARDRRQHPRPPRHRRAERALAARHRGRHHQGRVRDHRARRRHELAQPRDVARAARRRLRPERPEDLHLGSRARRRRAGRGPQQAARRLARAALAARSSTWTRRASPATRSRCPTSAPTSSGRSSSTTWSSRRSG